MKPDVNYAIKLTNKNCNPELFGLAGPQKKKMEHTIKPYLYIIDVFFCSFM